MKKWIALLLCSMLAWTSLTAAAAQGLAGLTGEGPSAASGLAGLMDDAAQDVKEEAADEKVVFTLPPMAKYAAALKPDEALTQRWEQDGGRVFKYYLHFGDTLISNMVSGQQIGPTFAEWLVENAGFELIYQDEQKQDDRLSQTFLLDHPGGKSRYVNKSSGEAGHLVMETVCRLTETGCNYGVFLYYDDPLEYAHPAITEEEENTEEPADDASVETEEEKASEKVVFTLPAWAKKGTAIMPPQELAEVWEQDGNRGFKCHIDFQNNFVTNSGSGQQAGPLFAQWLVENESFELVHQEEHKQDGRLWQTFLLDHPDGKTRYENKSSGKAGHLVMETCFRQTETGCCYDIFLFYNDPLEYVHPE